MLTISLPPELETVIRRKVESGAFASVDDALREAIRRLDQSDDETGLDLGTLRAALDQGLADLDLGRVVSRTVEELIAEAKAEEGSPRRK